MACKVLFLLAASAASAAALTAPPRRAAVARRVAPLRGEGTAAESRATAGMIASCVGRERARHCAARAHRADRVGSASRPRRRLA
jgi:hypothetical protein